MPLVRSAPENAGFSDFNRIVAKLGEMKMQRSIDSSEESEEEKKIVRDYFRYPLDSQVVDTELLRIRA